MKKKMLALALTAVSVLGLLAGCGGNQEKTGKPGSEEKEIRIGITSSPSGAFLKMFHEDTYNGYVTYHVYEGLTQVDPEGRTEPSLAKSWEISEDGRTYTFHLQENVTWHDGEKFSAEDVAFTYNFMADKDYRGFDSSYIAEIEGYDEMQAGTADTLSGVEVIDENTISITTGEVYSSALNRIGGINIVPEHIWKDVEVATAEEQTELIRNPIGTGAFKLTEFVPDQYVTLSANEDYWGGTPKVDRIIYVVVNTDTAQVQLLNGELDYLALWSVHDDDLAVYKDGGMNVEFELENAYQGMQINQAKECFAPVLVRQALAYAINRQGIVDAFLYGHGNVANTIYAETYWAYPGDENLTVYEYNPEKAIELFEELGYSYSKEENIMKDPEGEPVSWRLFVPIGNKAREQAATVIQSNLGDIGIEIDVETMEFATLIDILQNTEDKDRFDFALTGFGVSAEPDVSNLVTSDGASNYSSFRDEEVDALMEEALRTADEEKRVELYHELASLISEKLPVLYLYNWASAAAQNPKVHMESNVYWTAYKAHLWTKE